MRRFGRRPTWIRISETDSGKVKSSRIQLIQRRSHFKRNTTDSQVMPNGSAEKETAVTATHSSILADLK